MKKITLLYFIAFLAFSLTAQVEKKVIVEHFTNTRCGVCKAKNPGLFDVLADYPEVMHISYHPSSPYPNCELHQHNPSENDGRTNFYGVYGSTPRVVLQGDALGIQTPLVKPEQLDEQIGQQSDYSLTLVKTVVSGNTYKVTMTIKRVNGDTDEDIYVYAGLAEKLVNYNAPNGENVHHNVFRKVIYDGTQNLNNDETVIIEREYSSHQDWDEEQIYAYAVIHNGETEETLQAGNSLESPSFINNSTIEKRRDLFYPNPATDLLNVRSEYLNKNFILTIYSQQGQVLRTFNNLSDINISDLPSGFYNARLSGEDGRIIASKLVVAKR
jgi:hypothetical protein